MTKPINHQNQAIPAYSGITINITNPTLNAAPLSTNSPQNLSEQYVQQPYYATSENIGLPNYQVAYPAQYGINTHNKEVLTTQNQNSGSESVESTTSSLNKQGLSNMQDYTGSDSYTLENIQDSNTVSQNSNSSQTFDKNSINNNEKTSTQNIEKISTTTTKEQINNNTQSSTTPGIQEGAQQSYPPQYYINNHNYIQEGNRQPAQASNTTPTINSQSPNHNYSGIEQAQVEDMSSSSEIINQLNKRVAEEKDLEKNGKKTRIITLTNEYIMSLENYLNNPNSEIRLMAAKEVLTRLDEDKDRYNDAALNALLNKMLQDPNKLIRIAALSAFSSNLASGNNFTVNLLKNIQANPNADKEDVLQAANILLKMSSTTEIKYVPVKKQEKTSNNKDLEASQKQVEQLRAQLQQYKEKEIERMLNLPQGK